MKKRPTKRKPAKGLNRKFRNFTSELTAVSRPSFPPGPARSFEESLRIARGFLRLKFYIEDLVVNGGKAGVRRGLDIVRELLSEVGIANLAEDVAENLTRRMSASEESRMKADFERGFEGWFDRHVGDFVTYAKDASDIKLAYERGLALQAIVVSAAAFEDYVQTVTIDAVEDSPAVESRFEKELSGRFGYADIRSSLGNTRRALGQVVADSVSFSNPRSVLKHLEKLGTAQITSNRNQWITQYAIYLEYRNLAAHRAGVVDQHFKESTGYPGEVGRAVHIPKGFAEGALDFFSVTVRKLQAGLDAQKSTRTVLSSGDGH